jgi:L-asparaginase II
LIGLARAFAQLATSNDSSATRVAEAIRSHPEYVSGTRRDERKLLQAIPGAIAKAGAESCYVVALPDGRAFATKTDDGAVRARPVVMAALLEHLGVTEEPGVDASAVRRTGESPLLGGGRRVGEVRAVVAAV